MWRCFEVVCTRTIKAAKNVHYRWVDKGSIQCVGRAAANCTGVNLMCMGFDTHFGVYREFLKNPKNVRNVLRRFTSC